MLLDFAHSCLLISVLNIHIYIYGMQNTYSTISANIFRQCTLHDIKKWIYICLQDPACYKALRLRQQWYLCLIIAYSTGEKV